MAPFSTLDRFHLTDALRTHYRVEDGWAFAMERRACWTEIDGFGHVNNVSYLIYYEDARNTYLECVGLPPLNAAKPGPVIVESHERYLKPLAFEDSFLVTARTARLGNTSLTMGYAVWREGLCATGEATAVLMINTTGEKVPIPAQVRAEIAALDGRRLLARR